MRISKPHPKSKSKTRITKSRVGSLERLVANSSKDLSHRDLLYLSQAITTGKAKDINRMSNAGRKAYSTVKQTISPSGSDSKNCQIIRVGSACGRPISKEKAGRIINGVLMDMEAEMVKGIDVSSISEKLCQDDE